MHFEITQSDEQLTAHAGLVFVGQLLQQTNLARRLNRTRIGATGTPDISNGDVIFSYIGLLSQAQSDFDHIETHRQDPVFKKLLGIKSVPSSPTLRQRLEQAPTHWNDVIQDTAIEVLRRRRIKLTPSWRQHVAVDLDVVPFDNSNSHKEGVNRTYKGFDGYAPMMAYLGGAEGYCLGVDFREGKAHSQHGTPEFLRKILQRAQRVTKAPLLVRMDSGNDAQDNIDICWDPCWKKKCDFIIKRNLRRENPAQYLELIQQDPNHTKKQIRPGKIVYTGRLDRTTDPEHPLYMALQVTVRTCDARGQLFLEPTIETETWWTSLPAEPSRVIELYHDHGTMEQFHSEFKTDLNIERLPSGKMEVNTLIMSLSMLTFNGLRLVGQTSLQTKNNPLKKAVTRRRIRTIIQNLITIPARLTYHARQWSLNLGQHAPFFHTFKHIYATFEAT